MIRRFGESPNPAQRYHRRPGAYALLPRGQEILLTCQMAPAPDLQLPGGGIDPEESPLRALHREVMEETGWLIGRPHHFGTFRRFVYMPEYDLWAEKVCQIFVAAPVRQVADPSEPDHVAIWRPRDIAARELGNAGDRHFAGLLKSGC